MNKDVYKKYLERHKKINAFVDEETRKLSLKEKLRQTAALILCAPQLGMSLRKNSRSFTNWTLLKSKI